MNRSSTSMFSDLLLALATADLTVFSISRVALLLVNFNVMSASLTFLPRIRSMTSRAFCGDIGIYRLVALLIIIVAPDSRPSLLGWRRRCRRHCLFLGGAAATRAVALEAARG